MEGNFSRKGGTANTGHTFHFQISYKCKANIIQLRWEELARTPIADKHLGTKVTGLTSTFLSVATLHVQKVLNKAEYELRINK